MGTTIAAGAGYLFPRKASKVNRLISMLEGTFGILWTIFLIFHPMTTKVLFWIFGVATLCLVMITTPTENTK